MCPCHASAIMMPMHTLPGSRPRRVLVPLSGPQPAAAHAPRVRRYRLARLPLSVPLDPLPDRFAHLRRSYD